MNTLAHNIIFKTTKYAGLEVFVYSKGRVKIKVFIQQTHRLLEQCIREMNHSHVLKEKAPPIFMKIIKNQYENTLTTDRGSK